MHRRSRLATSSPSSVPEPVRIVASPSASTRAGGIDHRVTLLGSVATGDEEVVRADADEAARVRPEALRRNGCDRRIGECGGGRTGDRQRAVGRHAQQPTLGVGLGLDLERLGIRTGLDRCPLRGPMQLDDLGRILAGDHALELDAHQGEGIADRADHLRIGRDPPREPPAATDLGDEGASAPAKADELGLREPMLGEEVVDDGGDLPGRRLEGLERQPFARLAEQAPKGGERGAGRSRVALRIGAGRNALDRVGGAGQGDGECALLVVSRGSRTRPGRLRGGRRSARRRRRDVMHR